MCYLYQNNISCFVSKIIDFPCISENYQIIVDRDILDKLVVKVELRPGIAENTQIKGKIERQLRNDLQIHVNVEIAAMGTIERSIGKAKRVLDLRKDKI